jgi:alpha-1,2-mannosyltransferase
LLAAIFLVVNLVNAIRRESDFDVYVDAAQRLLAGAPLYEGSTIAVGFVGPPAQALPFVPFAPLDAIDPRAGRLAWYGVNVLLLWYALTTWVRVLTRDDAYRLTGRRGKLGVSSRDSLLALAGVAYPLQTQFEHQNLNIVLFALAAHAADALRRDRSAAAGVALGAAAALKVYPALALLWLAARRSWHALGAAIVAAMALSVAPVLLNGPSRFLSDVWAWRAIAVEGWPARRANQSVVAMWGRYFLGESPAGYPNVTMDAVVVIACSAVTAGVLLLPLLVATLRRSSRDSVAQELACVNGLAVVISPIAWEHYWVAWFPVLLALRVGARDEGSRWARWSFWVGALLITGLSRPTVGWHGARLVRALSLMTWGGLVTCGSLALLLLRGSRSAANFVAVERMDAAVAPATDNKS